MPRITDILNEITNILKDYDFQDVMIDDDVKFATASKFFGKKISVQARIEFDEFNKMKTIFYLVKNNVGVINSIVVDDEKEILAFLEAIKKGLNADPDD